MSVPYPRRLKKEQGESLDKISIEVDTLKRLKTELKVLKKNLRTSKKNLSREKNNLRDINESLNQRNHTITDLNYKFIVEEINPIDLDEFSIKEHKKR